MAALGSGLGQRESRQASFTVDMNITTLDTNGFRQSQGQITADASRAIERTRQDRVPPRGVTELCPACSPASAGSWSAGHVGEADGSIIAGLGDALEGHVT